MRAKSATRASDGLTLIELLIVIAVLALLAAFLLPAPISRKANAARIHCVSNLKQVGLGFHLWANNNDGKFPWMLPIKQYGTLEYAAAGEAWRHFAVAADELNSAKILRCPDDKEKITASAWTNFSNANLSYFVGLQSSMTNPVSLLSGDRNLTVNDVALQPGLTLLSTNVAPGYTTDLHKRCGNLGLGDGSVMQVTPALLYAQLIAGGTNQIRLVIP